MTAHDTPTDAITIANMDTSTALGVTKQLLTDQERLHAQEELEAEARKRDTAGYAWLKTDAQEALHPALAQADAFLKNELVTQARTLHKSLSSGASTVIIDGQQISVEKAIQNQHANAENLEKVLKKHKDTHTNLKAEAEKALGVTLITKNTLKGLEEAVKANPKREAELAPKIELLQKVEEVRAAIDVTQTIVNKAGLLKKIEQGVKLRSVKAPSISSLSLTAEELAAFKEKNPNVVKMGELLSQGSRVEHADGPVKPLATPSQAAPAKVPAAQL